MSYQTINFICPEKGIGLITLDRPERLNAITWELVDEVHECLSEIESDPSIRVVIITGAGRGFCSGTDLKAGRENPEAKSDVSTGSRSQRRIGDLVLRLRKIPQPVIAAVNGVAAGGGFSIAMAADIRIAAESARFVGSYINIGLGGGEMGSSYFLPRLIGLSRAAEIIYTGRFVESDEAERIGFVSRVVPDGETLEAALELARAMLEKSPFGLRMTKEVLNQAIDAQSLEAQLYLENRTQTLATQTSDFSESVAAFQEKRKPSYAGS
jgi:enoyl-CoA hydratase